MSTQVENTRAIAEELLAAEPALVSSLDFGSQVRQGEGAGPNVLIGDQAEIPLLQNVSQSRLDYRMACLARPSDIVIVRRRDHDFEEYLAEGFGQTGVTFLEADTDQPIPIAKQAMSGGNLGSHLEKLATGARGLTLKPYLTKGTTWRLAQHLGEVSKAPVFVCGPSPRVSCRINDKLWFEGLARRVVGRKATPPTKSAFGPAAAAGLVSYLAKTSFQVVVKVPDSAGSAGNLILRSTDLRGLCLKAVRDMLMRRLRALGWSGAYPILVGVWDRHVTCSPSAQLWIPHPDEGLPIVEGIFAQHIHDMQSAFVGAARSRLPQDMKAGLATEAVEIAKVLQQIGYYGRCSLDAVVFLSEDAKPHIHWIECNGRWGGVSIPMTCAREINGGILPEGLLIVQERRPDLPAMPTRDFLQALKGLLWNPQSRSDGIVVLSPPENAQGIMINFLAVASCQADAQALAEEALSRLRATGASMTRFRHG